MTHNEQDIERVAKAIHAVHYGAPRWSELSGGEREQFRDYARAALDAMGQTVKPCCEATEAIDGHHLVERHNHCTCGDGAEGRHEPWCGLVPLVDLRALDGWDAMGPPSHGMRTGASMVAQAMGPREAVSREQVDEIVHGILGDTFSDSLTDRIVTDLHDAILALFKEADRG